MAEQYSTSTTTYRTGGHVPIGTVVSETVDKAGSNGPLLFVGTLPLYVVVRRMVGMLELNEQFVCDEDLELESHAVRTARIAVAIARFMNLPSDEVNAIGLAARLHDVGKTKIDAEIINKPGPLDATEREALQRHPQIGYDMIHKHVDPSVSRIVLMHHERLDGCGYPEGVGAAQIGIPVRILHVADAYDAITSLRPYQSAMPIEHAISEFTANMDTQFDPDPVKALMTIVTYQIGRFGHRSQPLRVPSTLAAVS